MTKRSHPSALRDRLVALICARVPEKGRFRTLAAKSQLTEDAWRGMWYDRQRASVFMIEFAAREWPECAFWLATGITDLRHGHVAPAGVDQFPEDGISERVRAGAVFRQAIKIQSLRIAGSDIPLAEKALLDQFVDERLSEQRFLEHGFERRLSVAEALEAVASCSSSTNDGTVNLAALLEMLQSRFDWSDEKMAEVLDVDLLSYRASRYEGHPLTSWASRAKILDLWGYDYVHECLVNAGALGPASSRLVQ